MNGTKEFMMKGILIGLASVAVIGCGSETARSPAAELQLDLVGQYGSRDGSLALQAIRALSVDPTGRRIYVTQGGGEASVLVLSSAGDCQTQVPLMRVDRLGDVAETIASRSLEGGFVRLSLSSGRVLLGAHPAMHWDLACLDPRGRWLVSAPQDVSGSSDPEIELTWISPAGDTVRSVRVGVPPVSSEMGRADWEEEFAASFDLPIGQVRELGESISWPTYMPAESLVCDHEGRTWIQLPHVDPDSATWLLHGADGAAIGSVSLAANVHLNTAVEDQVWGWGPGTYDEPYVLRFRLSEH